MDRLAPSVVPFQYLLLRVDSCSWHLLFFTYYLHPTTVLLPSAACLLLHATSRNPRAIYPTQAKQARTTAPSNCLALTCVPGKPHTPRNPSATHLSRQFQQTPPTRPNTSNNPAAGSPSSAYITSSNNPHPPPEWPPPSQVRTHPTTPLLPMPNSRGGARGSKRSALFHTCRSCAISAATSNPA